MAPTVYQIARVAHEANRAYCESLGDHSQPSWENAEQWQRDSARQAVRVVLDGVANGPEEQHEAWMRDKLAQGWRFGEAKDATLKTHPCLVPYAELPDDQRRKDYLFRAVVGAMTAAT